MAAKGIAMQQPVAATPYQVMDPKPGYSQRYSASGGAVTGGIQVACGILALAFGIAAHVLNLSHIVIATGIWAGVGFFVVTGVLGIISAKRKTGVVIGYMVMSILSALAAFFSFWSYLAVIILSIQQCNEYDRNYLGDYYDRYYPQMNCDNQDTSIAINSVLTIIFLTEFIVSIVGSGFTCCGVCCGAPSFSTRTVVVTQQGGWPAPPPQYQAPQKA